MNSSDKLKIFCGYSHPVLGREISEYLGLKLGGVSLSKFSSGELYARIEETIRGHEVYVLQTITEKVSDNYMELFVMMDALKRASAGSINVIIPYFGYARQDRKSAPREPISSRMIADILTAVGLSRFITVDLHADQIQGFFNLPVDHLTAFPLFVDYFKKKKLKDLVIVAPDIGRAKVAKKLADKLGAELAIVHKARPKHNVSEVMHLVGDVKDKTVLLFDDMVDTAGSVLKAVEALRKHGCRDAYLAATHPVFSGPAVERLTEANFKEIVVTNTIPIPPYKQIPGLKILSIATLLAEVIKRNHDKTSISPLFS